jgi:hypothetical protein
MRRVVRGRRATCKQQPIEGSALWRPLTGGTLIATQGDRGEELWAVAKAQLGPRLGPRQTRLPRPGAPNAVNCTFSHVSGIPVSNVSDVTLCISEDQARFAHASEGNQNVGTFIDDVMSDEQCLVFATCGSPESSVHTRADGRSLATNNLHCFWQLRRNRHRTCDNFGKHPSRFARRG